MNETPKPPIDITTLAMEPPRAETLTFDPERDISSHHWQFFMAYSGIRNDVELEIATLLSLISPARFRKLGWTNPHWIELREKLSEAEREQLSNLWTGIDRLTKIAACIKILLSAGGQEFHFGNQTWENLSTTATENHLLGNNLEMTKNLKVLYPQRSLSTEFMENLWRDETWNLQMYKQTSNWQSYLNRASGLRLLFPGRLDPQIVTLTMWQKIRDYLTSQDHPYFSAKSATEATILAAQKVEITDRGIELVFDRSEPFTAPTPPMPVMKRF